MPRKPNHPPILCEHFSWRLFRRDGVWYADGRNRTRDLGKHSLGTRERHVALESLKQLDHAMATRLGLVSRTMQEPSQEVPVSDGWRRYMQHCERPQVMGGCSPNTLKRYRAVRDKHIAFCVRNQVQHWAQVDRRHVEAYGQSLHRQEYADRTIHFELTQVKTVMKWLIDEQLLPASAQFKLRLSRPEGSDRYCYRREEVQAMLAHCLSIPELRWMHNVIAILAASGLRIGELASLRRSDIDLDADAIVLADERGSNIRRKLGIARTTKGRRTRIISLNPGLSTLIKALPRHPDGRLLHGPRGGRLRPKTVLDVLNPHCAPASFDGWLTAGWERPVAEAPQQAGGLGRTADRWTGFAAGRTHFRARRADLRPTSRGSLVRAGAGTRLI